MIKLSELFDPDLLEEELVKGNVSRRAHPDDPDLFILNYTHQCQWDRAWNDVTRQCRGLIVRSDEEIVARPWPKFFNYGEHEAEEIDLYKRVRVQDKIDGSLGILYKHPDGGHAIATRGSFESDQAIMATDIWRRKYATHPLLENRVFPWTYLFEIVYPLNRVVVDYGDMEDLVLLDVLSLYDGRSITIDTNRWPGPVVQTFEHTTLKQALEAPPRPNAEGLVVSYPDGMKIKLKQEDYVALHRIITGLNEKTIWQHLREERSADELLLPLPDEFRLWAEDIIRLLTGDFLDERRTAETLFTQIKREIEPTTDPREYRKRFATLALQANEGRYSSLLFLLLDGKSINDDCWKRVRPSTAHRPREFVE